MQNIIYILLSMNMLRAFSGFGAISRLPMGIFRILGNLEMGQGHFPDSETAMNVTLLHTKIKVDVRNVTVN